MDIVSGTQIYSRIVSVYLCAQWMKIPKTPFDSA